MKRWGFALLGLLAHCAYAACDPTLAPTTTTRTGLVIPQINSCGWGVATNGNWNIIDSSMVILSGTNTFTGMNTFSDLATFPQGFSVDRVNTLLGGSQGGQNSVAVGNSSLGVFRTSGYVGRPNVAVGPNALGSFIDGGNTSQSGGNVGIGYSACSSTNSENTCVGDFAGAYNVDGQNNLFLGSLSGSGNGGGQTSTHGNDLILLGQYTGPLSPSVRLHNSAAVGAYSHVTCNDCMTLGISAEEAGSFGNPAYNSFNVGIGTAAPTERLHIVGKLRIEGNGNGITFPDGSFQTSAGGGGGSGGNPLAITRSGVVVTSPTTSMNFFSSDFNLGAAGSTSTIFLNSATTDFIHAAASLQSGATFYVSSGSILGQLNINNTAATGSFIDPSNIILQRTAGSNNCIRWSDANDFTGANKPWAACKNAADFNLGYQSQTGGMTSFINLETNGSFPVGSTVTMGVPLIDASGATLGSLIVNGAGPGIVTLNEGSNPSGGGGAANKDVFWASSSSHSIVFVNNNTSTYTIVGSSTTPTIGHVASWSGQGTLIDGGTGGGSAGIFNQATLQSGATAYPDFLYVGSSMSVFGPSSFVAPMSVTGLSSTTWTNISTYSATNVYFSLANSPLNLTQTSTGAVNAVVITSTGSGNALSIIEQGQGGGSAQQDNGGALNISQTTVGDALVIMSSYTDSQIGTSDLLILDRSINRNDPIIRVFKNASNSAPEMRWDSPVPNMEIVATSTDNIHGRGKWEPFAIPSASEILQVNYRCYDNSSFSNEAYWEPLNIQTSVSKPGLFLRNSDSTGCDSTVVSSSNTSGVNFWTVNNHTIGITGPLNVNVGSWRWRLPHTVINTGQVLYEQNQDSSGDYPLEFTVSGSSGNFLVNGGTSGAAKPFWTQGISAKSKAQLGSYTPLVAGEIWYCSDCATDGIVVSTGTTVGGFARISARTTAIN